MQQIKDLSELFLTSQRVSFWSCVFKHTSSERKRQTFCVVVTLLFFFRPIGLHTSNLFFFFKLISVLPLAQCFSTNIPTFCIKAIEIWMGSYVKTWTICWFKFENKESYKHPQQLKCSFKQLSMAVSQLDYTSLSTHESLPYMIFQYFSPCGLKLPQQESMMPCRIHDSSLSLLHKSKMHHQCTYVHVYMYICIYLYLHWQHRPKVQLAWLSGSRRWVGRLVSR